MRVVRFYKNYPSSPSSLLPLHVILLLVSCSPSSPPALCCNGQCRISIASCRSQWAALGLNKAGQIPVGSAGPQPGSSQAAWAAPDLTRGAPERRGQHGTSSATKKMSEECQKICQKRTSEDMLEKDVRRNVRKYVRKGCRKICQKICQKRMSEDMLEKISI